MLPASVTTVTGRNEPPLKGVVGSSSALRATNAAPGPVASPPLTGSDTWGDEPVKSTVAVSPAIPIRTLISCAHPGRRVGLDEVTIGEPPVGEPGDGGAHGRLGPIEDHPGAGLDGRPPEAGNHFGQPVFGQTHRPEHGRDVEGALAGESNVRPHQVEHRLVGNAPLVELDEGNDQTFLVDVGGHRRDAPQRHAPDVQVVPAHGGPKAEGAVLEMRREERDVVEMRAQDIRVVDHEDVARCDVVAELLPDPAHRQGPRYQVDGCPLRNPEKLARRRHQGAGEILRLLDLGPEGGQHDVGPHLANDGQQRVADELDGDGVGGHGAVAVSPPEVSARIRTDLSSDRTCSSGPEEGSALRSHGSPEIRRGRNDAGAPGDARSSRP